MHKVAEVYSEKDKGNKRKASNLKFAVATQSCGDSQHE